MSLLIDSKLLPMIQRLSFLISLVQSLKLFFRGSKMSLLVFFWYQYHRYWRLKNACIRLGLITPQNNTAKLCLLLSDRSILLGFSQSRHWELACARTRTCVFSGGFSSRWCLHDTTHTVSTSRVLPVYMKHLKTCLVNNNYDNERRKNSKLQKLLSDGNSQRQQKQDDGKWLKCWVQYQSRRLWINIRSSEVVTILQ